MDVWSVACTVYELFTAEILFKGRDNNDMLRQIMALKGPFPKRMIKKGLFSHLHFAGAMPSCFPLVARSHPKTFGKALR
jgi:serine/threonine protein kinase